MYYVDFPFIELGGKGRTALLVQSVDDLGVFLMVSSKGHADAVDISPTTITWARSDKHKTELCKSAIRTHRWGSLIPIPHQDKSKVATLNRSWVITNVFPIARNFFF